MNQEIEEKLSPEQEFIEEEQTKPEEVNSIKKSNENRFYDC